MKNWEVWAEGYRATGEAGTATLLGRVQAETFHDAVIMVATTLAAPELVNLDRLTYWGCQLYDNETDARKYYG